MHLETPRLHLREFVAGDWPAVLAYQSDPRYLRYYEWTDRSPEDVRRFVGMFIDQQRQEPRTRFQLAVTLRDGGRLIGNCGVRLAAAGAHEGEIGYELAPDEWGKGYATEAARAIVRFGFEELGLHRIAAWTVADNTGSARVLQKLGMTLEGRLRDRERYKGRYWDVLMYAMLKEDAQVEERDTSSGAGAAGHGPTFDDQSRPKENGLMAPGKIDGTQYGYPPGMSQPSLRALLGAGYTGLEQLAAVTAADLLKLHGMGPKGVRLLREALAARGLAFAGETAN